jgi:hypothetical protein
MLPSNGTSWIYSISLLASQYSFGNSLEVWSLWAHKEVIFVHCCVLQCACCAVVVEDFDAVEVCCETVVACVETEVWYSVGADVGHTGCTSVGICSCFRYLLTTLKGSSRVCKVLLVWCLGCPRGLCKCSDICQGNSGLLFYFPGDW